MTFELRQWNQANRIAQGIASGQLTQGELARLQSEQSVISGTAAQAQADGVVSPMERLQLKMLQDAASHDIYSLKHNDRSNPMSCTQSPPFPPGFGSLNGSQQPPVAGPNCAPYNPNPQDTSRMDARLERQRQRIGKGLEKGDLTPQEAQRLLDRQVRIQDAKKMALADGQVTDAERKQIEKMQDKASKEIYKLRHNKERAKDYVPPGALR